VGLARRRIMTSADVAADGRERGGGVSSPEGLESEGGGVGRLGGWGARAKAAQGSRRRGGVAEGGGGALILSSARRATGDAGGGLSVLDGELG